MIDQNMVRELNAGTFPKPNYNLHRNSVCKQFIISVKQPENIREDVVRIDHAINSKFQLMGHYLHDAMENTFFPPLWAGSFATVGTAMQNPSYTAAIKLTQTYSSSLLNETGVLLQRQQDPPDVRSPVPAPRITVPTGWTATSLFPIGQSGGYHARAEASASCPRLRSTARRSAQLGIRLTSHGRTATRASSIATTCPGPRAATSSSLVLSWLHTYKNQELQANTNGTATFNNNAFSKDWIVNMMLGMAASWNQLEYLYGKNWVNNNYSFYMIDNWHVSPRLTLNLGLRYDGMPHAFERYNKFSNFVPGSYNTNAGESDPGRQHARSDAAHQRMAAEPRSSI